ncbi:MAG: SAM-dependent methyltransferase [Rhodobacteraceae bacterium]|nr:SAM-dependent methyltransferase [Paracoccaceae bacterium]
MTPVEQILRAQIKRFGPISVAEYMNLCLLHPDHGYYMQGKPIGRAGDFITAPEISQMFGELLGLALAQSWLDQGAPVRFALVELGPGRGTLMADMLRATAGVPGFLAAAEIWLVEASPALVKVQAAALAGHKANWVASVSDLPDLPIYLIANEFFDALPIRQFQRTGQGWQERMIGLDGDKLVFGLAAPLPVPPTDDLAESAKPGQMVEVNKAAEALIGEIGHRIEGFGGTAMVIDYGEFGNTGDSFQAVRNHEKQHPLANPGQADLTAHVDFAALAKAAGNVAATPLTPQGELLHRLGIGVRAETLAAGMVGEPLQQHLAAYHRLTSSEEMGSLFKAIAFHRHGTAPPPGFSQNDT